jgi:ABC-type sugar transport system substrate-binding protein
MADDKYTPKAEAKAEPKAAPKASLGPAGETSDPAVHDALARLAIARSNRDALDVDPADVEAADDAVKEAEKALADLGYQA